MKNVSIMNFNLVYFEEKTEKPLLAYFDTIIMPALKDKVVKKSGDAKYFFMNVRVIQDNEGEYVLTGLIVKQTILEIKSDIDENGNLVEKNDKYPTAPYSMFVIYLKNHRMLYIENQKGSPDIRNFKATIKFVINTYVNNMNKIREENGESELPIPIINITGIPMRKKIEEALKDVAKVNKLTLRFYPLNGDVDYTGILDGIRTDLRKIVGSKRGEIVLKSPQNISGVAEVVSQSEGTVDAIFEVTYPNKRKGKIKNDELSERISLEIQGETFEEELINTIQKGKTIEVIKHVSDENQRIYEMNTSKIVPFVNRRG